MVGILVLLVLTSPLILVLFALARDRSVKQRDQRILDKADRIAALFSEIAGTKYVLIQVYLESSRGTAYPYDMFMIEYYGGAHPADTIWLPTRDYLDAPDDTIRQILANELAHPGHHTIADWTEAVYQYITREKQNPTRRQPPRWKRWLKLLDV